MSSVMPSSQATARGVARIFWVIVAALALYFIYEQVLGYFVWNEDSL